MVTTVTSTSTSTATSLDGIRTFLAVADAKSFSVAARRLGISPTAASKAVRVLEARHGITLFTRTTRSVALTEAGHGLVADLTRATGMLDEAFDKLSAYRDEAVGKLRLTVPRGLGAVILRQVVPRFRAACPQVSLDISLDDGAVDLVAQGFDAGIRLGQQVEQDMVAVALTPPLGWSVVASPAYLQGAGRPLTPEQLVGHAAVRYRFHRSQSLHRWRFVRDGVAFYVEANSPLVVDDTAMIAAFARAGLGLAYLPDIEIAADLASGHLVAVLQEYVPPTSGLYLYFPARSQNQRKLRAFIDVARLALPGSGADAALNVLS